jgi:glutathione S-transferase
MGIFVLLEGLGVPFELKALDMQAREQRQPEFLAINPMGKAPTIVHKDVLLAAQGH